MKISTKLSLALVATTVFVLGASAGFQYLQGRTMLLEETQRDDLFLGRALRELLVGADEPVVLRAMRSGLGDGASEVRVSVLAPGVPTTERAAHARAQVLASGRELVELTPTRAYTYIPLDAATGRVLELAEPLTSVDAFLERELHSALLTTLFLALAGALATTLLVQLLVRRPMQALAAGARRIASGDLSARVPVERPDEIGAFARELNTMASELELARARLADESAARVATLEQLRHADRLRTVGQLASALAHELGTPLNVVSGRARMIEEAVDRHGAAADEARAGVASDARIIVEQSARMAALVRQLLDFARMRGPDKRAEDARALVRDAVEMLRPIAKKSGVTLSAEVGAEPCMATVDRNQLLQALTNLVVNAIQASSSGATVTVRVGRVRASPPRETVLSEGEFVEIAVEDHGAGIDAEARAHMFDPFFTTKGAGEGTGLGLPVAHGIVREHGGWIGLESEPGQGSTFRIFVPASTGAG